MAVNTISLLLHNWEVGYDLIVIHRTVENDKADSLSK